MWGPLSHARYSRRHVLLGAGARGILIACGENGSESPPSTTAPLPTNSPGTSPTNGATVPIQPATATSTATQSPQTRLAPIGFPIDEDVRTGLVRGEVGERTIAWGEGPSARTYSRDDQPSDAPVRANGAGWNARVHLEYENWPAVDWYLPTGTPVYSTMSGTATLFLVTAVNPFDVYGVSREPYIGNPDRVRAPITPFTGPGGGMGVLVRVTNDDYRSDYGHFDLAPTAANVPANAFLPGFDADSLASQFADLRGYLDWTAVARWAVDRGALIGFSGDTGYSEAPHLHYAIARADGSPLCPTNEPGVPNGGWLFRGTDP